MRINHRARGGCTRARSPRLATSQSRMRMRELPLRVRISAESANSRSALLPRVCECRARCSPLPARSLYCAAGVLSKHGHTYADPGTGQHSGRGATEAGRNVPGRGQWRQNGLFSRQVLSLQDVRS